MNLKHAQIFAAEYLKKEKQYHRLFNLSALLPKGLFLYSFIHNLSPSLSLCFCHLTTGSRSPTHTNQILPWFQSANQKPSASVSRHLSVSWSQSCAQAELLVISKPTATRINQGGCSCVSHGYTVTAPR